MTRRLDDFPSLLSGLRAAEGTALTFYRGRRREGQLTYPALVDAVERLAGHLSGVWALRRGERIAVLSHNRVEVPVLLLAALRLGAAVVPLNPMANPETWTYAVSHSGVRLLFASAELAPALPPSIAPVLPIDGLLDRAGGGVAEVDALDGEIGVILYTSGTTGEPKGVALRQRSLIANARSIARCFGLDRSTQLAVLPLYHAHAFGFGLMTALATRGHLVLSERFDPFCWAEVIRAHAVTVTSVVPTLLPAVLEARAHRDKVPTLDAILVSSAPLGAPLAREFESRTGIPLVQGWGLSEYTNFACCLSPYLEPAARAELLCGDPELTSVGAPLAGTEVRVVDSGGRTVGEGHRGELSVRGHSTMLSYLRDDEATRNVIDADGWLRTGDEGLYRMHRGEPVFFVTGRLKEIIIRDGEKLSPLALERRLLAELPELEGRLVVLGFPHRTHGEEVGAYLEGGPVSGELARRLFEIAGARVVLFGHAPIPRTHTGKVQRRRLVQLFAEYADCRGPALVAAAGSAQDSSTIR